MRVAVFGATGNLGREVVQQAVAAGLSVSVLARDPGRVAPKGERVHVVRGNFGDRSPVAETVSGADGVVSAIGYTKGQPPEVYGQGMAHVVAAMSEARIRRLVSVSGAGLEIDGDAFSVTRQVLLFALRLLSGKVLKAKELEWDQIRTSGLDWVLVRPGRMIPAPPVGAVVAHPTRMEGRPMVAYADVAKFMLAQLTSDTYLRAAPMISGATP